MHNTFVKKIPMERGTDCSYIVHSMRAKAIILTTMMMTSVVRSTIHISQM